MYEEYRRPYILRRERNISIAFIFLAPFLAFIRLELIYITLLPTIVAGTIIIYNCYLGNMVRSIDPVGVRYGFIEIDQYSCFSAVLHDDRFIQIQSIESAEVVQYITSDRKTGEKREMRRIVFHTHDKKEYSIDRESWIIRNVVNVCKAWNKSHAISRKDVFEEEVVQTPSFFVNKKQMVGTSSTNSNNYAILGFIICFLIEIVMLSLVYISAESVKSNGVVSFCLISLLILFTLISSIFIQFLCIQSMPRPRTLMPIGMMVEMDKITVRGQNGEAFSFPWSSVLGVMATPTDDYPHPFSLDYLFFSGEWGVVVMDDLQIFVKIEIADKIQSIYFKKFGFYPNKYWYTGGRPSTDDFTELQRYPKVLWREAREKRINN